MKHPKEKAYIHVDIKPELKSQFKETCDSNCHSMTKIVIKAIVDYCKKHKNQGK